LWGGPTDTRLGRQVALKLLPEDFAVDPERQARFEREAKVLASLNHPNIAVLYGLEHVGERHALVMELVEGDDLAQRLARGPIATDEAFAIALQVASALEAAHDKGIVHRDLKPANVKVTPAGTVKVLDFGLAKAWEAEGATTNPSLSPTITAHHTREGVILGTAAYMSPEQARGKPVDRRADIWAFGCLVYEMLTGTQTFAGDTVTDVIAAVVTRDPDWSALPPDVRPRSREVLRRCMEKDPKRRFRDIGDVRFELEESLTAPEPAATAAPVAAPAPAPAARRSLLPWVVAGLGFVIAAGLGVAYLRVASVKPRMVRSFLLPPEKTSFAFDPAVGGPVLSPDGTRMVFAARDAAGKALLYVRALDSLSAQSLAGTESASYPFWSPDGRFVGFFVPGKLKKIDAAGGPPETICAAPSGRGGAWSQEGVIVFAPDVYGALERVSSTGGASAPLTSLDASRQQNSHRWPTFLPDGRHFVYWAGGPMNASEVKTDGIYLGSLDGAAPTFLFQADSDAVYAPPGYLLFLREQSLMAQPFEAGARKLTGEAFPIAEQVANPQNYRHGCFTVSDDRSLSYQTGDIGLVQVVWLDASGRQVGTVGEPAGVEGIRLSPDGQRLAEHVAEASSKNADVWIVDLARGVRTRFTFGSALHLNPIWSPDGSRIVFTSNQQGHLDLYVKSASGAGDAEAIAVSEATKYPTDWSPDGRFIAVTVVEPGKKTGSDLWMLSLSGERKMTPFLSTEFNEGNATFSPDGRWLAYQSNASGRAEVYLTPFPGPGGKWQVSQDGGAQAMWRRDGAALYFRALDGKLMQASIVEQGAAVEVGTPTELLQAQLGGVPAGAWAYAAAPKGDRVLVMRSQQNGPNPLTLVTNWTAGLRR
jgi:Tol biopolymer transport system component